MPELAPYTVKAFNTAHDSENKFTTTPRPAVSGSRAGWCRGSMCGAI